MAALDAETHGLGAARHGRLFYPAATARIRERHPAGRRGPGRGRPLGWLDRTAAAFRGFSWLKTTAALVGVILATFLVGSWAFRGPGVAWQHYSDPPQARKTRKAVIIDFYATWCTPCRELDEVTFHQPDVVKLADRNFVMLKVDLTQKRQSAAHPPAQRVRCQGGADPDLSGSMG